MKKSSVYIKVEKYTLLNVGPQRFAKPKPTTRSRGIPKERILNSTVQGIIAMHFKTLDCPDYQPLDSKQNVD